MTDDIPLRHETPAEHSDRNWSELLQELRVTQTGVQILAGFLLTVPFSARFDDLTDPQRAVYLAAFSLAGIATLLLVAPVSMHRLRFHRGEKDLLVARGDVLAKAGLVAFALALLVVTSLIFWVVLNAPAAIVAFAVGAVACVGLWGRPPRRRPGVPRPEDGSRGPVHRDEQGRDG